MLQDNKIDRRKVMNKKNYSQTRTVTSPDGKTVISMTISGSSETTESNSTATTSFTESTITTSTTTKTVTTTKSED